MCWGLTLSWPHQAGTGLGREEPGWLALGPLEGTTDIWPMCLSQDLVREGWPLAPRGHRDHVLCLPGGWILSLSPGSLPSLTLSARPRCPEGQQQGLSLKARG